MGRLVPYVGHTGSPRYYSPTFGEVMTLSEWAEAAGVTYAFLLNRLDRGMDFDEALTAPTRIGRPPSDKTATCCDNATQCLPGGGSELLKVIGDRRGMARARENLIGVFSA